jgi:IS605 OrfB family transposase
MADDHRYRTIVTHLRVAESDRRLLERTIDHWRRACDTATDIAWPEVTDAGTLQSVAYDVVRKRTDLGSQHSILAIRQAASTVRSCLELGNRGRSTSKPSFTAPTITYDPRCMTVFDDGTVSLATVEGRVTCELALPDDPDGYQHQFLDDEAWTLGESTLTVENGGFRLHLGFKKRVTDRETAEDGTVLGVDLGVENLAVTSTARFFSGRELQHVCREFARRRRELEETGTRSSHLTAQRIAGRERRYIRNELHEISRAIVDEARTYECSVIVLEELEGIYDTIATAAFAHRWAYRRLCEFIEYKTEGCGIRVEYVDPRYTSQRCSECGHGARQNRPERSRFECANCGSQANADYNAAKNVALRYVRGGRQSSSRTGTRRCALKSGTVNPNGEYTPYPDGSEDESADKSVA